MASRAKPSVADHTPAPPLVAVTSPHTPPPDASAPAPTALADYRPVPQARVRHDGWTAVRQRRFLTALAETGSISQACRNAGVSSRSAYRLRQRADAQSFAAAWDQALRLATLRLTTLAFERAVKGSVREVWRGGELVGEVRQPSDKLLMFLLQTLLPRSGDPGATGGAGMGGDSRLDRHDRVIDGLRAGFPAALDRLSDHPVEMEPVVSRDFFPERPGDSEEDM